MVEKSKKYIYKTRYITEFALSLIFIFFLAKMLYTKIYIGYFHKAYLLGSIIFFLILMINVIYNFKKSEKKIEKIFLNIAIPIGLLYLFFMIPGHVPDETTHFYKAYDISKGNISTNIDKNGESYINVPKGLSLFNHYQVSNYKDFVELAQTTTNYSDTENVISTAQGSSSIMYIFSALGFFIARLLNINIIYGIFLGKTLNFLFFSILSYLTIKKIPFAKILLAIYMLMPMNLQQVTSISPDAFINAILLYYLAFSIYMIFKKEKLTKKEIGIYIGLTAVAGIVKMVYILLAGVGFLIIKRKDTTMKKKTIIIALTVIIGSIFTIGTYIMSMRYTSTTDAIDSYNEEFNVNAERQIEQIKENPQHIIKALKTDWYDTQKEYMFMAIGSQLGWLEIKPSETVIILYLILLIIAAISEKNAYEFNWKNKLWLIMLFVGITLLVEFAMYTTFTPVGAEFIGGVQGRYYIPTYIILLLCLSKKENYIKIENAEKKLIILAAMLNISVITEIIQFFIH